jgi:Domain of unknown function (DUF5047)
MIDCSDECHQVLDGRTFVMRARASVSLAGRTIASDLPIAAGNEEFDGSIRVPERVQIKIPRVLDGVDMIPTSATHPLAPYGQRLHVSIGIGVSGGVTEWLNRGEFLTQEVSLDGDAVAVTAVGLLALVDEARLVQSFQPSGTFVTALRQLVEPAVTIIVDPAVLALDRTVPAGLNEDEDRIGALYSLLDAWPASAQITPGGWLAVKPAGHHETGGFVQLRNFIDSGGAARNYANILEVGGSLSRDGLANVVVARGMDVVTGTGQYMAAAYDKTPGSPTSLLGPFNPLPVPIYYFSPLLASAQQCQDAAVAMLRRKAGLTAQKIQVNCVPDPRMVGNDLITYVPTRSVGDGYDIPAVVERMTLPYTSDSGPMILTLREETA